MSFVFRVCVYVSLHTHESICVSALGVRRCEVLELQAVVSLQMWVLGTEQLGSSQRAGSTLNHRAINLDPMAGLVWDRISLCCPGWPLTLVIFLSLPPQCQGYRRMPLYLAQMTLKPVEKDSRLRAFFRNGFSFKLSFDQKVVGLLEPKQSKMASEGYFFKTQRDKTRNSDRDWPQFFPEKTRHRLPSTWPASSSATSKHWTVWLKEPFVYCLMGGDNNPFPKERKQSQTQGLSEDSGVKSTQMGGGSPEGLTEEPHRTPRIQPWCLQKPIAPGLPGQLDPWSSL